MRIIGGLYKGRTLYEFKGNDIRPTSDFARESLFNIINQKIVDKTFLDLFCGTGAVGLEALSRGAKKAVFCDISRESINLTKKNVEKVKTNKAIIILKDAISFIDNTTEKFDYIFIDSPYQNEVGVRALSICSKILADGGTIIYENQTPLKNELLDLILVDQRKYGRAYLSFYQKR